MMSGHESLLTGGTSGPAIVPGDPDGSLLMELVRERDPEYSMPPKHPLAAEEVAIFERWIDWEHSARTDDYVVIRKRYFEDRGVDRFELPASAVTAKLVHAVESPRPKARYYLTWPTHFIGVARRVLPVRALDWILSKG